MKNRVFGVLLASLTGLFLFQSIAQAKDDENIYLGGSVSVQTYSHQDLDNKYILSMAVVRLGADVNANFGVESRFGFKATSSAKTEAGRNFELSNTALYGLYIKPRLKLMSIASVYGLLGATNYDLYGQTQSTLQSHFEADRTRGSAGAGLELNFFKGFRLNGEVMLYGYDPDVKEIFGGFELGGAFLF